MITKAATIYDSVRGGMICLGHIKVEPGVIAANTNETIEIEVEGVREDDAIFLTPTHDLLAGLVFVGATVTDEDEISVTLRNVTEGSLTGPEKEWSIMILKRKTPGGCESETEES